MSKIVVFRDAALAQLLGVECRETVNDEDEIIVSPLRVPENHELLHFRGRLVFVEEGEMNLVYIMHAGGGLPEAFSQLLLQCDTLVTSTLETAQFFSAVFHKRGLYCPLPLYSTETITWKGTVDVLYLSSSRDTSSILGSSLCARLSSDSFAILSYEAPCRGGESYRWGEAIPRPKVVVYMPHLPCAGISAIGSFLQEGIPIVGTPLKVHYECLPSLAVPWVEYYRATPIIIRLLEDPVFYESCCNSVQNWMSRRSEVCSWFHLL